MTDIPVDPEVPVEPEEPVEPVEPPVDPPLPEEEDVVAEQLPADPQQQGASPGSLPLDDRLTWRKK